MKKIIILSDVNLNVPPGTNRYIAPYLLSTYAKKMDIKTIVVDYFLSIDGLVDYISNILDNDVILLGISSTLLSKKISAEYGKKLMRTERSNNYYGGYLWTETSQELYDITLKIKEKLTEKSPSAKLILGGAKTMFVLRGAKNQNFQLAYQNFDLICLGLGDKTFPKILESLIKNTHLDVFEIGKLKFLKTDSDQEINMVPRTEWNDYDAIHHNESLPIEISRGCLYNCKFCYYDKKSSIIKDVELLKEEFIYNYENFGTTVYNFCDDCFNDTKIKVELICNTILSLPFKIEWVSYARVDLAVKFPETFDLMIESGCRGVSWGLESFNYESAKMAGKGVPTEKVKERLLEIYSKYKNDCIFQGTFIAGLPKETPSSLRNTVDWLLNNRILDFISFGVLVVTDFDPELDQNFIDYSDYVRNPQKYGFKKLTINPYYWEHDTMNRPEAIELAKESMDKLKKNGYDTYMTSIWAFSQIRNCGYTWNEILDMARNSNNKKYWWNKLKHDEEKLMKNYWEELDAIHNNRIS